MIAMPVIAWADSAVYSLLALEYRITDPARRLQVRQARTVLNVLRPVLGFANAALKIGTGRPGTVQLSGVGHGLTLIRDDVTL